MRAAVFQAASGRATARADGGRAARGGCARNGREANGAVKGILHRWCPNLPLKPVSPSLTPQKALKPPRWRPTRRSPTPSATSRLLESPVDTGFGRLSAGQRLVAKFATLA